jgi:hypothetical protein
LYVADAADAEKKTQETIERKASYECLLSWRHLAQAKKAEKEKRRKAHGFFDNLFGPKEKDPTLQELYQKIGFDQQQAEEQAKNVQYPPDYAKVVINARIIKTSFRLVDSKTNSDLIELQSKYHLFNVKLIPNQVR